jgi:hypothetical protein
MIHRLLVTTAVICSLIVSASFVMFARDQLAGASKQQQTEIVAGAAPNPGNVPIHKSHQQPREFIDNAANELTSPFHSIVDSSSAWLNRGVPTLLALLVYGVGLGYAARYSSGMS